MKGENNPRWNGGNSQYPNHAKLKRARIEVLKKSKGRCEICGKIAKIVHHIDGNKGNQSIENLMAVCTKCHVPLHNDDDPIRSKGRPTKYNLIYGLNIKEIAKYFGVTTQVVYYWIRKPEKRIWLEEQLKNKGYNKAEYHPVNKAG
jgi:hypothetical protein